MIELNKKTIIILLVVVIVVVGAAGAALTLQPEEKKKEKPKPVEVTKTMPPVSGWLSSPEAAEPGETSVTIKIDVNGTELLGMSLNITIKDDDGSHSQTDEGSEPDKVSVKVGDDIFEVGTEASSGEGSVMKEYGKNDMGMFNDSIEIVINGVEFGGGVHPTGPIGIVPIPFLVYIDQGCAYYVEITYKYNDYSGKAKDDSSDKEEK